MLKFKIYHNPLRTTFFSVPFYPNFDSPENVYPFYPILIFLNHTL